MQRELNRTINFILDLMQCEVVQCEKMRAYNMNSGVRVACGTKIIISIRGRCHLYLHSSVCHQVEMHLRSAELTLSNLVVE